MPLRLRSAGGGSVLLKPPVALAADVSMEVPGYEGAKLLTDKTPGCVLQVVQAISTTNTSSTSTAYADAAGMVLSITPSSASSKILVLIDAVVRGQANDSIVGGLQILRGATAIHTDDYAYNIGVNANVGVCAHVCMNYLDSPNTTSAIAYKLQLKRTSLAGTGYNFSVNPYASNRSVITLMEIAA